MPEKVADVWRVKVRCDSCRAEIVLDSEDKPGEKALKIARSLMVCAQCDSVIEAAYERRLADELFYRRLNASGLPDGLRNLGWKDMDRDGRRRNAVTAVRAWSAKDVPHAQRRIYLSGSYGTGKTRLAATAAWSRLEHGPVTFMSVPILLQAAFAPPNSEHRRRASEAMMGFGALILDDLGKEAPGEWARQVLFGAIDSRIQAGSPILITSNHDADMLSKRLGEAFGSRLREFQQYELAGEDRRSVAT